MIARRWGWAALVLLALGCTAEGGDAGDERDASAAGDAAPPSDGRTPGDDGAARDAFVAPPDGASADDGAAPPVDAAPDAAAPPADAAPDGAAPPVDAAVPGAPRPAGGLCAGCGALRSPRYLLVGALGPADLAGPPLTSPRFRLEPGPVRLLNPAVEDAE